MALGVPIEKYEPVYSSLFEVTYWGNSGSIPILTEKTMSYSLHSEFVPNMNMYVYYLDVDFIATRDHFEDEFDFNSIKRVQIALHDKEGNILSLTSYNAQWLTTNMSGSYSDTEPLMLKTKFKVSSPTTTER